MTPLLNPTENPAAICLAEIVTKLNDRKITRFIGKTYNDFDHAMRELAVIEDRTLRKRVVLMIYRDAVAKAEVFRMPAEAKSFFL